MKATESPAGRSTTARRWLLRGLAGLGGAVISVGALSAMASADAVGNLLDGVGGLVNGIASPVLDAVDDLVAPISLSTESAPPASPPVEIAPVVETPAEPAPVVPPPPAVAVPDPAAAVPAVAVPDAAAALPPVIPAAVPPPAAPVTPSAPPVTALIDSVGTDLIGGVVAPLVAPGTEAVAPALHDLLDEVEPVTGHFLKM